MSRKNNDQLISPISIDLGSKNTGVLYAHYPAGTPIESIQGKSGKVSGKVYVLEKGAYTLMMNNRTASRHARRGHDRRQMAKRLFKLIWCGHFGYDWDDNVQQTIGFLMNRRGFSYLTEQYNADILENFPPEVWKLLPDKLRKQLNLIAAEAEVEQCNLATILQECSRRGRSEVEELYNAAITLTLLEQLRKYCEYKTKGSSNKKISQSLSELSVEIVKEWKKIGVKGIRLPLSKSKVNIIEYIDDIDTAQVEEILCSISKINHREFKKDNWNFNHNEFDLEKVEDSLRQDDHPKYGRSHLHHLLFAIHQIYNEITSGGRYRSKYFEEVKNVLKDEEHTHNYLQTFCSDLQQGKYDKLDIEKLTNLIGHISNMELKPLRKYFNNLKHKNGDKWNEEKINKVFRHWILKEWRVGKKDKRKQKGEVQDYRELQEKLKNCGKDIFKFWLNEDPIYTIPPYQDNNNRRPPKCQSFILNTTFLDDDYKNWEKWLDALKKQKSVCDYLGDYEERLRKLTSGKGKPYFNKKTETTGQRNERHLQARILQFILDRVKVSDPLNLNEMYSHIKKIRQNGEDLKKVQEAKEKLEKAIKDSELASNKVFKSGLETVLNNLNNANKDILPSGGFLHLICEYYRLRQRAKEGRIFIHPCYKKRGFGQAGHYDDKDFLLTYCNHKPRQKRYQVQYDIAGLLQVSLTQIETVLSKDNTANGKQADINQKIIEWLDELDKLDRLKTICEKSAKWQKDLRGSLNIVIIKVYGLLYHRGLYSYDNTKKEATDRMRIDCLKKFTIENAKDLYRLCENAKKKWLLVTDKFYSDTQQEAERKRLQKNPAAAVYQLAQLNNIAFKERNGNANTCAVCSVDNLRRMQVNSGTEHAQAQRLPAIETRMFDGAVKRLARILGKAIAEEKWKTIRPAIEKDAKVRVPIIIESNRFEFEPDLREIKAKIKAKDKDLVKEGSNQYKNKEDRIKEAGHEICPYTGEYILSGSGEIEHIIPRSSKWGTLNDEANLIYASKVGNATKGERDYYLSDLDTKYKKKLFGGQTDNKPIQQWIVKQIVDESGEGFSFGPYRSFINLTPDQQKAFRHALFLPPAEANGLRGKVINAIDARTRTFVNGTQRYVAQVIANELHKRALKELPDYAKNLTFDYYSVEAGPKSHGNTVYDLRKHYEKVNEEIKSYQKDNVASQELYSHLIDAMLAFVIVADEHRGDGGLKLTIPDKMGKAPHCTDEGEIKYKGSLLEKIYVPDGPQIIENLERRSAQDVETDDREKINKKQSPLPVPYKIHRDSIYAEHFFPLRVSKQDKTAYFAFNADDTAGLKWSEFEKIEKFYKASKKNPSIWVADKREIQKYLMKCGREGVAGTDDEKICKILDDELSYQTIKKNIVAQLAKNNKKPSTVKEALDNWDQSIKEKDFKKNGVLLPVYNEWLRLKKYMEQEAKKDTNLSEFLPECELFKPRGQRCLLDHTKVIAQLAKNNKKPSTVKEALDNWDQSIKEKDFKKNGVLLPVYNEWLRLKKYMEQEVKKDTELSKFLHKCKLFKPSDRRRLPDHTKVRKIFSLPVIKGTLGNIRIKRNSWTNAPIVQIQSQASIAKYGVEGTDRPRTFLSENAIPIEHYSGKSDYLPPSRSSWISVPKDRMKDFPDIISASIRNKEADRCRVRIIIDKEKMRSLPINENFPWRGHWKGKIKLYKTQEQWDQTKGDAKSNNKVLPILLKEKEKWQIFKPPFRCIVEENVVRDNVIITDASKSEYQIEYTVTKNKEHIQWLNNSAD